MTRCRKDYSAAVLSINFFKLTNATPIDTSIDSDTLVAVIKTACKRSGGTAVTLTTDTIVTTGETIRYLGKCDAWTGVDSLLNDTWIEYTVWDSTNDATNHGTEYHYYIEQEIQPKR